MIDAKTKMATAETPDDALRTVLAHVPQAEQALPDGLPE